MKTLRVLHAIQNLNYGGMERLIHDLVLCLDPTRFEPHILTLQYLGRFAEGLEGRAGLHVAPRQEPWSLLHPGSLTNCIRSLAPDVVHTHSGVWYKASLAARRAGVRRLLHTEHGRHSPDPWTARTVDGLAARRTDVVVAVSLPLADYLRQRVIRGSTSIVTVPNGVDTEAFRPRRGGALRRELGLEPDRLVIGSVGRLQPVKCYDLMLEAFSRLVDGWEDDRPPALVVVGEGAERARLERMLEERGNADPVFLLGWRDDVHEIHAALDVFTLSSRSEGTSVSLLEAMSAGLCPVVTDVGGNAAVLGQELEHRLVPPGDAAPLARAWRDALRDPEARRRDGIIARERVCRYYDIGVTARAYVELYEGRVPAELGGHFRPPAEGSSEPEPVLDEAE